MQDVIQKLLTLQDRDRRLLRVREQLAHVPPERTMLQEKAANAKAALEAVKLRGKQVESERKRLELEVSGKQTQIDKYSTQQLQTKKNEEYKALTQQIEHCKEEIRKLEDQELELMEQADVVAKQIKASLVEAEESVKFSENQLKGLGDREQTLKTELGELEGSRPELLPGIEDGILSRYERLLKSKNGTAIVGIEHGVCGGCHMKFPTQLVIACQADKEMVTCPNCGRILYYTRDMDLAVAD